MTSQASRLPRYSHLVHKHNSQSQVSCHHNCFAAWDGSNLCKLEACEKQQESTQLCQLWPVQFFLCCWAQSSYKLDPSQFLLESLAIHGSNVDHRIIRPSRFLSVIRGSNCFFHKPSSTTSRHSPPSMKISWVAVATFSFNTPSQSLKRCLLQTRKCARWIMPPCVIMGSLPPEWSTPIQRQKRNAVWVIAPAPGTWASAARLTQETLPTSNVLRSKSACRS